MQKKQVLKLIFLLCLVPLQAKWFDSAKQLFSDKVSKVAHKSAVWAKIGGAKGAHLARQGWHKVKAEVAQAPLKVADKLQHLFAKAGRTKEITIFVHGTTMSSVSLILPSQHSFCRQKLVPLSRQPLQQLGLHEVRLDEYEDLSLAERSNATWPLLKNYQAVMDSTRTKQELAENLASALYAFGWSGGLSQAARLQGAHELYAALQNLYYECLLEGYKPVIRLICHSHGGNVCLLLAQVVQAIKQEYEELIEQKLQAGEELPQKVDLVPVQIHSCTLLGTPIQLETQDLITDDFFKNTLFINLSSEGDSIQISDYFSTAKNLKRRDILLENVGEFAGKLVQGRLVWSETAGGQDYLPTHADLWLARFETFNKSHFGWLPAVCLLGPVIEQLEKICSACESFLCNDVQLTISREQEFILYQAHSSNNSVVETLNFQAQYPATAADDFDKCCNNRERWRKKYAARLEKLIDFSYSINL